MISYRFHPDQGFLRRGALRCYFQVAQDWRRFSVLDIVAVSGIVIWQLTANRAILSEFGFPAVTLSALMCCALAAVMIRTLNIAFVTASLWFGVRPRPMPTQVDIALGQSVRCRDMSETAFVWSSLTKWRRYDDMYVLLFQDTPVSQCPVFISRAHLGAHEAAFAQALAVNRGPVCAAGLLADSPA
jgi:hypothetical protein